MLFKPRLDAEITSILRGICPETLKLFFLAIFITTSNCSGVNISYAFKKSTSFLIKSNTISSVSLTEAVLTDNGGK